MERVEVSPDSTTSPAARRVDGKHSRAVTLFSVFVSLAILSLTGIALVWERARVLQLDREHFLNQRDQVLGEIGRRVDWHALQVAQAIFAASERVERDEFHTFARLIGTHTRGEGALGFGYMQRVDRSEIESFQEQIRAGGEPDFTIHGADDQARQYIVRYSEPESPEFPSPGLNVGADERIRQAAERAMASAEFTITRSIAAPNAPETLFLGILPVYAGKEIPKTVQERTDALKGWVYMPFQAQSVLGSVIKAVNHEVSLRVYESASLDPASLIFEDWTPGTPQPHVSESLSSIVPLMFGGRTWTVVTAASPDFKHESTELVFAIPFGGVTLALLLATLIHTLGTATRRATSLAMGMTQELRKLALVAERADNTILLLNDQGRIIWANDTFTRSTGHELSDVVGKVPIDVLQAPSTSADTIAAIKDSFARGTPLKVEVLKQTKAGRTYWSHLSIQPLRDQLGRTTGFITVESDITERVLAHQQLASVFAAVGDGIVLQDGDGKIIDCNPEASLILGLTKDQLLGRHSVDPLWHTIREDGSPYPGTEHPAMVTLRTGQSIRDQVMGIRLPEGSVRWISINFQAIHGSNGSPASVVTCFHDITARRLQDLRLRLTIEGANLGTWDWNPQTDQAVFSDRWFTMLGYQPGELPQSGATWASLLHPDDAAAVLESVQRNMQGLSPEHHAEARMKARDGSWVWVQMSGRVLERDGDGKPTRLAGVHIDVSAAHRVQGELVLAKQAAEAAAHAKSEFLANMSHEIRTPMTAILGYVDLLHSEGDLRLAPTQRVEYINTIRRNGEHLLTIVNDILDMAKIESGKMSIENVEVRPVQLLVEVLSLMRIKADAKHLALEAALASPVPSTIRTDPTRLKQILVNLIGNAIKFTEIGRVSVTARLGEGPDGPLLCFDVADTGMGMSDEQAARLFRAFEQADASTTRRFGGTGLGLLICRRLCDRLGGDISVKTKLGVGSTFTFSIATGPIEGVRMTSTIDAVPDTSHAESGGPSLQLAGRRILLAEDGVDNRRLITFYLTRAGAEVVSVGDGQQALDAVFPASGGMHAFDLILTDMQMPVMDGYTAVRALRARGCKLPIVALTAHAMSTDRQLCLDAGCDAYISKPIEKEALVKTCRDILGPARSSRAA